MFLSNLTIENISDIISWLKLKSIYEYNKMLFVVQNIVVAQIIERDDYTEGPWVYCLFNFIFMCIHLLCVLSLSQCFKNKNTIDPSSVPTMILRYSVSPRMSSSIIMLFLHAYLLFQLICIQISLQLCQVYV